MNTKLTIHGGLCMAGHKGAAMNVMYLVHVYKGTQTAKKKA